MSLFLRKAECSLWIIGLESVPSQMKWKMLKAKTNFVCIYCNTQTIDFQSMSFIVKLNLELKTKTALIFRES